MDFYPDRSSAREKRTYEMRLLGTGAANPTMDFGGQGVVVTRTGVGAFLAAFNHNPGKFDRWDPALGAAVPANLKQCSLVRGVWNAATRTITFSLFDGAGAARELAANEYIDLAFIFQASS